MMTTSISALVYLLLISNLLLVSAVGLAVVRFLRRVDEFESFWESPNGKALAEQKTPEQFDDAMLLQGQRLEKRMDDLHRIVRIVAAQNSVKRPPAPTAPQAAPVATALPTDYALRMAKQGATIDDLTKNCGLSIGEAKLMQKLHGKNANRGVH